MFRAFNWKVKSLNFLSSSIRKNLILRSIWFFILLNTEMTTEQMSSLFFRVSENLIRVASFITTTSYLCSLTADKMLFFSKRSEWRRFSEIFDRWVIELVLWTRCCLSKTHVSQNENLMLSSENFTSMTIRNNWDRSFSLTWSTRWCQTSILVDFDLIEKIDDNDKSY
jgi:hypothetical protein